MKLQTLKRPAEKKREVNRLRREGFIPAVIYRRGQAAENISVSTTEYNSLLRNVESGRLSTKVFTLFNENGVSRKAVLKEVQYNVINYEVIHLDFEELHEDESLTVKIPIECVGIADCKGIKLGGALRQPIRYVRVKCLPKDIPDAFFLDIKDMALYDTRKISDLPIPESVKPMAKMNEVAVVIVKR
jgi:large subunit ribosomal protein L25